MRNTVTALLFVLCPLTQGNSPEATVPNTPLSAQQQLDFELLSVIENFDGAQSKQHVTELLDKGANPNAEDTAGDTPLLLLCKTIEQDYRYLHDHHFAQAVNETFELLLSRGANALHENHAGCSTIFFLQSKPELLNSLKQNNLIPKELAVRIPYDTLALIRYMKLRVRQADLTMHDACRQYLCRKYCAPAYDRAEAKLTTYLESESIERIPQGAPKTCLAFMRLADSERAQAYVANMVYWEHSEHFIEDIPLTILQALHDLNWQIDADKLRSALKKLQTLLPKEGEDMISCNSARPMILILEMLEQQDEQGVMPLIREYATSRDPELAYHAYKILLRQNNLLAPDELEEAFNIDPAVPEAKKLPEPVRKVYECAKVDAAMRRADLSGVSAAMLIRVEKHYRDMGLTPYADTISMLLVNGELSQEPFVHQTAFRRYRELVSPAPGATISRFILEHPEHFRIKNTHQ